jgi:predicted NBD/HSP70 family sugar kinase
MITAVDMGATKTLIAQFNDKGEQVNHLRFQTPTIAADWVRTLNSNLAGMAAVTSLVIGLPGQLSPDGSTVLYCGNLPWRNVPLQKMLAATHKCPIFLANDAAMAGLGEVNALDPLPRVAFYLALGTGIGGALIVNGKLVPGLTRFEPGHMMLKTGDTWTEWEDMASGHAIVARFNKMAKDLTDPKEWQWIAENVAQGLSPIIATLLPEAVVVGGGVGRHFEHFHGLLAEKLRRRMADYITMPDFMGAVHLDDAVLYGCYFHALHQDAR